MKVVLFCGAKVGGQVLRILETHRQDLTVITTNKELEEYCLEKRIQLAERDNIPECDVIFSVYYDKRIPVKSINKAPLAINFHGGKLPEYAGCFSNIWSIINGEEYTCATAHMLEEKFDTGDILDEIKVKIEPDDTGGDLYYKVSDATLRLFLHIYYKILNNDTFTCTKQDLSKRKYYKKGLPDGGFVNIQFASAKVYDFIRALDFPPYEPAHTLLNGKKIYLYAKR